MLVFEVESDYIVFESTSKYYMVLGSKEIKDGTSRHKSPNNGLKQYKFVRNVKHLKE